MTPNRMGSSQLPPLFTKPLQLSEAPSSWGVVPPENRRLPVFPTGPPKQQGSRESPMGGRAEALGDDERREQPAHLADSRPNSFERALGGEYLHQFQAPPCTSSCSRKSRPVNLEPFHFLTLIGATLTGALLTRAGMGIAQRIDFVSRPKAERWSQRPVALGGGVAIYAVLIVGLAACSWDLALAATALFLLGLVDDRRELSPRSSCSSKLSPPYGSSGDLLTRVPLR